MNYFNRYFKYKYLLLGLGMGNKSVERFFIRNNIKYESFDDLEEKKIFNKNIRCDIASYDIIVKSSGISSYNPLIVEARKQGKLVVTDLELFGIFFPYSYNITVTGSNGKTTTVNLLKKILKNFKLVGNVGKPIFDVGIDEKVKKEPKLIIEASSFMLEYVNQFNSKYVVLLNIVSTHLEHHGFFSDYIRSKMRILKNCDKDTIIVYNYDDVVIRNLIKVYPGKKIPFSLKNNKLKDKKEGIYLLNNYIYYYKKKILNIKNIKMIGEHNIYNVMASIGVSYNYLKEKHYLFKKYIIKKGIKSFKGVEHRLEYVMKYKNVLVYNDSKSTNYNALRVAINAFKNKKILLICGGKNRNDNYNLLRGNINDVYKVYCFGENRMDFYKFFLGENKECYYYETLKEVINNLDIRNINVILFSPGSISYDQYIDYERRGKEFKWLMKYK